MFNPLRILTSLALGSHLIMAPALFSAPQLPCLPEMLTPLDPINMREIENTGAFLGQSLVAPTEPQMTSASGWGNQFAGPLLQLPMLPPVNYYLGGPLPGAIEPGDFVPEFTTSYMTIKNGETTFREWNAPWNRIQPVYSSLAQ